jgi:phosphoribosylaminoimidazolecarboxamide formyltransferase/IMP cyclohydrolase
MHALLSVSDKTGLIELAQSLHHAGVKLISTGGSAALIAKHGLPVIEISDWTGSPEMLDGRVKTLHPKVHAGLLARQDLPEHVSTLSLHGMKAIDILVVNLYPFEHTVAQAGCTLDEAIEQIDIGGPAMVRSGAKNWKDVAVLTDPSQYAPFMEEFSKASQVSKETKFKLAQAAFNRISQYDGAISQYLSAQSLNAQPDVFPEQWNAQFVKLQDMRYGENPHQLGAFYRELHPANGTLATAHQIQGKALSYNNIADADAALECVKSFPVVNCCVIVKHANPCGVGTGETALEAYQKAFKTDPTSAFGGIIAFNREVDAQTAKALVEQFMEVLMAPSFTPEALAVLSSKVNVRVLQVALSADSQAPLARWDYKRVGGGMLVQTADLSAVDESLFKVVTKRQPTAQQYQDLLFAWRVAQFVKSNAIVYCKDGMTLGVGAGQMSRLDSARIASIKAQAASLTLVDSVVASDAFFPFRDGLDVVIQAGARAVIQPGGSMRDQEVIDAANEQDVAMVFTQVRHFRH